MLDISPSATKYVEGAVNINYEELFWERRQAQARLRIWQSCWAMQEFPVMIPLSSLASVFPAAAAPLRLIFTYWLLKYLGHEKVESPGWEH